MALGRTVEELSQTLSLEEFNQWQEFLVAEPLPSERIDEAGSVVAAVIVNVNRGKGSPSRQPDEFNMTKERLKRWNARFGIRKVVDQDVQEANHLKSFILSMGGSVR